jgi:hypothetical protein
MTGRKSVRIWRAVRVWAAAQALTICAFTLLAVVAAPAQENTVQQPISVTGPGQTTQQQSTQSAPVGDVFSSGGAQTPPGDEFSSQGGPTYTDEFASSCEKANTNNPYAGMDPLKCYGVMAPTDSAGKCSLGGMQVLKQEGSACYYCQLINPPIQGFIVPMDVLPQAEQQGFSCGADQADPQCSAVCRGNAAAYKPPAGTTLSGGAANNCGGTLSACSGQGTPQTCQTNATISNAGNDAEFVKGFVTGLGKCAWAACANPVTVGAVALAIWKSEFQQVANLFGIATGASTLQSMMQGGGEKITSTDPYQIGLTEGQRFCTWEAAWFGVTGAGVRAGSAASASSAASEAGQCAMQMPQGLSGVVSGASPAYKVCPAGSGPPPCNVSLPAGLSGLIQSERTAAGTAICPASTIGNFRLLMQDLSWLKGINPTGCTGNCGTCSLAVAQALLGKGVMRVPPICINGTLLKFVEGVFGTKFIEYKSTAAINNAMSAAGDGAQGIVWVGEDTAGHIFNIVNDNGAVRLLDGQTGTEITWTTVQGWMQQAGWKEMGLLRTN